MGPFITMPVSSATFNANELRFLFAQLGFTLYVTVNLHNQDTLAAGFFSHWFKSQ